MSAEVKEAAKEAKEALEAELASQLKQADTDLISHLDPPAEDAAIEFALELE